MTEADTKQIVERWIEGLTAALYLHGWSIVVTYERLDEDTTAECHVNAAHANLHIRMDPEQLEDESEVVRALRHELLHAVCWPMQGLLDAYGPEEHTPVTHFFIERMIAILEHLFDEHADGLGVPKRG